MKIFKPNCMPLLIGSLPILDHIEAVQIVLKYSPEIPLWPQLPKYKEEQMIDQFISGLPAIKNENDRIYMDTKAENFNDQLTSFYEEYIEVSENLQALENSRFKLTKHTAKGFFDFINELNSNSRNLVAVKGQVTGPITMGIGLKNEEGRSLFYDDNIRDVISKHISMKAKWQTHMLSKINAENPPIIFLDEPGVVSFGSSTFISISREQVSSLLSESINAIHDANGLCGIHICANGDWSLALDSDADIISFDAYSFFDNFVLYKENIINFINSDKIFAWGIVPTSNPNDIEKENIDSLLNLWHIQTKQISDLGIDFDKLMSQSFITPSCGTGSISINHATKVLELTRDLSNKIRERIR